MSNYAASLTAGVANSLFRDEQRHKPQSENASTWQPTMVELIDGRVVDTNSEEWRAECEAMTVLSFPMDKRQTFFEQVERHRQPAGLEKLKRAMSQVLPRYVLELPTRDARRAYLTDHEKRISKVSRERLEGAVRALWERRQASACNTDCK
jgi:hypothetical protein